MNTILAGGHGYSILALPILSRTVQQGVGRRLTRLVPSHPTGIQQDGIPISPSPHFVMATLALL